MKINFKGINYLIPEAVLNRIASNCAKAVPNGSAESYRDHECLECKVVFKRFYANKTDFCCRCRQIQRQITHESCCEIKSDYPKTEALRTMRELESYYSSEKITCLLCGNEYSILNQHLRALHDISADDYKLKFGLPLSRGLNGTVSHKKMVAHGNNMVDKYGSSLPPMPKGGYKVRRAEHSPALKQKSREVGKKMSSHTSHISNQTGTADAFCSDCGSLIGKKTIMTITTKSCCLLCKSCKSEHHKKSQENWAIRKGINLKEFKSDNAKRHYLKRKAEKNVLKKDKDR